MRQSALKLVLALALMGVIGAGCDDDAATPKDEVAKNDPNGQATETNGFPVMCDSDEDCPEGIACARMDATGPGYCDVGEMLAAGSGGQDDDAGDMPVSSAAPAMCGSSDDCPDGIECVMPDGPDGIGFCDVNEMQAGSDGVEMPVSMAAPAVCTGPGECPEGIECVMPDGPGGVGFCDVTEMQAQP